MTSFVKTDNGLKEIGRSKIRNYESVSDVCQAIADGCLTVGDLFTTVAAHGITEDLEAVINCLVSITPNNASPTNMLVTQDQLNDMDIGGLEARVTTNENNIATLQSDVTSNTSLINQIGTRLGVAETNITSNYTTLSTNISDLSDHVDSVESTLQSNIDSNTSCIQAGEAAISQLQSDLDDTNTEVNSIDTALTNIATRVADLSNCAGLDCTGTLTSDDLNGLTCCIGTVTGITNSTTGDTWSPDSAGNVTMRIPTYTLSGTRLTITY